MIEALAIAVLISMIALIAVPYMVYVCVKLGTYAFYCGRQLFEKENKNGETAEK